MTEKRAIVKWGGEVSVKLRVGAINKQGVVGGYCNGLGPTLVPRRTDGLGAPNREEPHTGENRC